MTDRDEFVRWLHYGEADVSVKVVLFRKVVL